MLLVYTHKITNRVRYIFEYTFGEVLGVPMELTTDVATFVAHNGLKMSYTNRALGNEFWVKSHDLLFERFVHDIDIVVSHWEQGLPCFFKTTSKASVPYDIFAAAFYLITRYEEYLPYQSDSMGRFTSHQSLAFKNDFLEKPIVNQWVGKFWEVFQKAYEQAVPPRSNYRYISTFNVVAPYLYRYKGLFVNFFGFCVDVFGLRWRLIARRWAVVLRFKKDPYDVYQQLVAFKKEQHVDLICFFLLGKHPNFNQNINIAHRKYRYLLKMLADYFSVGLMGSYDAFTDKESLRREITTFQDILYRNASKYRQHRMFLNLPQTYRYLNELGIEKDYTMGYDDTLGFRAGTCTPFHFYDLGLERRTNLKIYPFSVCDIALKTEANTDGDIEDAFQRVAEIQARVKAVSGTFITFFQQGMLSDHDHWAGWRDFYQRVVHLSK